MERDSTRRLHLTRDIPTCTFFYIEPVTILILRDNQHDEEPATHFDASVPHFSILANVLPNSVYAHADDMVFRRRCL